jgi:signal transduction histidine kinase
MPASEASPGRAPRPGWDWRRFWRYSRALVAPVAIWALLVVALLLGPLPNWLHGEDSYDESALREWLEEARNSNFTLAEMIDEYVRPARRYAELLPSAGAEPGEDPRFLDRLNAAQEATVRRVNIDQALRALAEPTKVYSAQLPLFPVIYRLEVRFDFGDLPEAQRARLGENGPKMDDPVVWDSDLPVSQSQYHEKAFAIHPRASVLVRYQLHAYSKRQRAEQEQTQRVHLLTLLAVAATALGAAWLMLVHGRERDRERQRLLADRQVAEAERLRSETERQLLEQRLATQAAERQALELKSHLYASIGIMAGSYAHNIKNLLVRPNDLLRRCLDAEGLSPDQELMLREVRHTLGTVTERLQQILQTVRRDPSQSELRPVDLNAIARATRDTWHDLARDRWKLDLTLDLGQGGSSLWIAGDVSHLQQAVENLLFNARDATLEMRNHLRESARRTAVGDPAARREAVIAAAAWRGRVTLRTRREGDEVVLEVSDNGAGMTEEVRRRCTETHFSTKRDNAIYEGHSTGMGLGLSFVVAILEHHRARLEIESEPLRGATFRARFPPGAAPAGDGEQPR